MHVTDAIRGRRSHAHFDERPLERELMLDLLDAARWAPNHHKTEPWRFVVIQGDARARFGDHLASRAALRHAAVEEPARSALIEKERRKPLEGPAIIAVGVAPVTLAKATPDEELAAVAAATQNILLSAHLHGLATKWRSGEACKDPAVVEFLGLAPGTRLIGLVYLGWPASQLPGRTPPSLDRHIRWLDA